MARGQRIGSKRRAEPEEEGGAKRAAATGGGSAAAAADPEEENGLVFEDPFGDDVEEEEDVEDGENEAEDGEEEEADLEEEEDEEEEAQAREAWMGDQVGEGEELVYSSEAYVMFHALPSEWPCLSLDVWPDLLGSVRPRFPAEAYFVAGTQAARASENSLLLINASDLHRTKHDSDDEDEDEEDDGAEDDNAVVRVARIPHPGGVNRVRVMPQAPHVVASWSETGMVHLWDARPKWAELEGGSSRAGALSLEDLERFAGVVEGGHFSFDHGTEGFAMDWSPVEPGRLATGDCNGGIRVWDSIEDAESAAIEGVRWDVSPRDYTGHGSSVEDIQWAPDDDCVFASCGCDGTVRMWDARVMDRPSSTVKIADCDVNVLAWNARVPFLILTGADDGTFAVWDTREMESAEPVAKFSFHSQAITSVAWDPFDENCIAVSSEDDRITIWDLSIEADEHSDAPDLPPQLLFIHQGQHHIKEVRFHPQLPGTLLSTAATGFNIFRPDVALA